MGENIISTKISINGHNFSPWFKDGLEDTNKELVSVLKTASKYFMDNNLLRKNESSVNKLFRFQRTIGWNDLDSMFNSTYKVGYYGLYDNSTDDIKSSLSTIINLSMSYSIKSTEARGSSHPGWVSRTQLKNNELDSSLEKTTTYTQKEPLQGVVNLYKGDNYIYQEVLISHPYTITLNRYYDFNNNRWSVWRILQTS